MKTTSNFIPSILIILSFVIFISSCNKRRDGPGNAIQQGNTTIEINAIYPNFLQVRYNNVIDAPIKVGVTFFIQNGQQKVVPVTIPAGYKKLQPWGGNEQYINAYNYSEYNDSTGNAPASVIQPGWIVDSVKITSVSCPDKKYGFKVLTGADQWDYFHPTDPRTTVSFITNQNTFYYADFDFNNPFLYYYTQGKVYGFSFFNQAVYMLSGVAIFPIQQGMTLDIPYMNYFLDGRKWGSQPYNRDSASNGSTLKLTVTNVTDTHFDATFSGKLWSSFQQDTLFISNGELKNGLLPVAFP
jgi:hypothetical protein